MCALPICFDLTPFYPADEDVLHWHRTARDLCAPFGDDRYPAHKRWCDEYFFLKHRNETRGVGGLFFDDLHTDFERDFDYLRAVGDGFLDAYMPIVERRRDAPYGERERQFQRSEEHTSELQSLMRNSYAVFCLQKN